MPETRHTKGGLEPRLPSKQSFEVLSPYRQSFRHWFVHADDP